MIWNLLSSKNKNYILDLCLSRDSDPRYSRDRERSIVCARLYHSPPSRARSRFNRDAIPARPLYSPQGNHLRGSCGTVCYIVNGLLRKNTWNPRDILEYRTSH